MSSDDHSQEPSATTDGHSKAAVLELYKLAVEMADRVSGRRAIANSFFATLHAALLAVISAVFVVEADEGSRTSSEAAAAVAVALGGLILAGAWFLALRSYRDLNRAKYKVIQEIEDVIPVALFANEWKYLKDDPVKKWRGRYAELGTAERIVPLAFALLYVAAGLWVLLV